MSKIRHSKIVFPDREHYEISYSDELVDLVSGLLKKDKNSRLGAKGDAAEILAHPFFSPINTEELLSGETEPPFLPATDSRASVVNSQYFNIKTGAELAESIVPKANLKAIRKNQDAFDGFYQKTAAYRK